jgi:hypothetical protein
MQATRAAKSVHNPPLHQGYGGHAGCSSAAGTRVGAVRCSTSRRRGIEQIRTHGADPFAYFEWVFEKLMHNPPAEELESLLPVHWLKARAAESAPIDVEAEAVA